MIFGKLVRLFGLPAVARKGMPPNPKVIFTRDAFSAVEAGLAPEIQAGREGIVYLLGRTDGLVTLVTTIFRPRAETTSGSFYVSTAAMVPVISTASQFDLQVVGQLHTHPGQAYHSDGDVDGAKIRYEGFISIVLPNYGRKLPDLKDSAVYISQANHSWRELSFNDIIILPGAGPWTVKNGSTSETTGHSGTQIVV